MQSYLSFNKMEKDCCTAESIYIQKFYFIFFRYWMCMFFFNFGRFTNWIRISSTILSRTIRKTRTSRIVSKFWPKLVFVSEMLRKFPNSCQEISLVNHNRTCDDAFWRFHLPKSNPYIYNWPNSNRFHIKKTYRTFTTKTCNHPSYIASLPLIEFI